jgi:hypothetical protein
MVTFEINGIGFELSVGEIDKSKFEYWKDKEISEEDKNEDNEFSLFKDHWTDLSDIFHDNGPAMLENTKLEVKENNKIILETYLGAQDLVGSKINFKEYKIKINNDYYFLGYQHDKGIFYKTELETKSFEIDKLLITYETITGFSIITDIEYDGESIDKGDYSTTTKEISLNVNQNNE